MDSSYWQQRYERGETGWDIGAVSTPLQEYFDQLTNKEMSILIPGAGNGYEAEYLHRQGFENVFVIDFAESPLINLQKRMPDFPANHLIHADFFDHTGAYELIVEQTFFSAIDPALRQSYAQKMSSLLTPGGKLVGVLWSHTMRADAPPFGGSPEEYRSLFSEKFELKVLAPAYNSIPPRAGNELFIHFRKEPD